jgi:peptidyl-prolyl cis-trans isomerase B (cyclophilin B)
LDSFTLQCGDPSGTGVGGPGYEFDDENLPLDRHPPYPRGTVAMANTAPNGNGSQFFMVYRDGDIDPSYPVFGTVTEGLDVLDRIASAGADDSQGSGVGRPKLDVTIQSVTVST